MNFIKLLGPLLILLLVAPAGATVNAVTARNDYVGNASTTIFPYTFKIFLNTDIEVIQDGATKTLATHYSVSGLGASGGGNITFVTVPATNSKITLLRKQPQSQISNYVPNEAIPAARIMADFDKAAMSSQMQAEQLSRSFHIPKYTFPFNTEIDPVGKGGKCLGINSGVTSITTFDCAGGGGGGGVGTILGSIAATQVAFGTTTDTIGGSNEVTYNNGRLNIGDDPVGDDAYPKLVRVRRNNAGVNTIGLSAEIETSVSNSDSGGLRGVAFVLAGTNSASRGSEAQVARLGGNSYPLYGIEVGIGSTVPFTDPNHHVGVFIHSWPGFLLGGTGVRNGTGVLIAGEDGFQYGIRYLGQAVGDAANEIFSVSNLGVLILDGGSLNSAAQVILSNTGFSGVNIKMTGDGAATPAKTMRVRSGIWEIINNAYTAPLVQVEDAGVLNIKGAERELRLWDVDFTNYVGFQAPDVVTTTYRNRYPGAPCANGEALLSDGSSPTQIWSCGPVGSGGGGGISSIGGQAGPVVTLTNDTNVTLAGAGNAIVAGWTGVLSEARGGFPSILTVVGDKLGINNATPVAIVQSTGAAQTTTPTLGSSTGAALLLTNTDPTFGMMFGVDGFGRSWIQGQRVDGTGTAYNITLQPAGAGVIVGSGGMQIGAPTSGLIANSLNVEGNLYINGVPVVASGIIGSGVTGQMTFWNGTSAIGGSNNNTWDNTLVGQALTKSTLNSLVLKRLTLALGGDRNNLGSVQIPQMYGPSVTEISHVGGLVVDVSNSTTWTAGVNNSGASSHAAIFKQTLNAGFTGFGIGASAYLTSARTTTTGIPNADDTYGFLAMVRSADTVAGPSTVGVYSLVTSDSALGGIRAPFIGVLSNHTNTQTNRFGLQLGVGDVVDTAAGSTNFTAGDAINIRANTGTSDVVEAWTNAFRLTHVNNTTFAETDRFKLLNSGFIRLTPPALVAPGFNNSRPLDIRVTSSGARTADGAPFIESNSISGFYAKNIDTSTCGGCPLGDRTSTTGFIHHVLNAGFSGSVYAETSVLDVNGATGVVEGAAHAAIVFVNSGSGGAYYGHNGFVGIGSSVSSFGLAIVGLFELNCQAAGCSTKAEGVRAQNINSPFGTTTAGSAAFVALPTTGSGEAWIDAFVVGDPTAGTFRYRVSNDGRVFSTSPTDGIQITIDGVSGGGNGANLRLTHLGAATPSKTIRARGGLLEIMDNAYTNVILALSDAGALSIDGGYVSAGQAGLTTSIVVRCGAGSEEVRTLTYTGGLLTNSGSCA